MSLCDEKIFVLSSPPSMEKTNMFSSQSDMDGGLDNTKIFSSQSHMVG
jgi:hypothetical protein